MLVGCYHRSAGAGILDTSQKVRLVSMGVFGLQDAAGVCKPLWGF